MHPKRKGNIGEIRVALELSERGYSVFKEIGDISRIDLISEVEGRLLRIQVKYVSLFRGCYNFVSLKSGPGYKYSYKIEDVDVFALYCVEDGKVAWIWAKDFIENDKTFRISLRSPACPTRNNQANGVKDLLMFTDFEKSVLHKLVCPPVLD